MQQACSDFLQTIGMAETVAAVAAACPAAMSPAPCTDYAECDMGLSAFGLVLVPLCTSVLESLSPGVVNC